MALNNPSELSLPQTEDETPRSPRTAQAVTRAGLPALQGEEAQTAAAESVRDRLLADADDVLTAMRSNQILTDEQADTAISVPQSVTHEQVHQAQMALNRLRHQTEAGWWLANQARSIQELLDEAATPSAVS